jgi:quercetin dioxygenase-like cupin family protein
MNIESGSTFETGKDRLSVGRRQALTAGTFAALSTALVARDAAAQTGLAPNPRSNFEAHVIDNAAVDGAPLFEVPFNPGVKIRGYSAINQPNCQVIIEDFMPGDEFVWTFVHDEFQYCLSGEMEVQVWLPPLYDKMITARITPGTVYVYPLGARKKVKVIGDKPMRHICFCPPSPNYPFPTLADLKAAQEAAGAAKK